MLVMLQYFLIIPLLLATGVSPDSLNQLKSEANRGNVTAQIELGDMYASDSNVPQDFAEAAKWYRKGADQGNALAQCNLGQLYAKGEGVPHDYTEAYRWCQMAADQGLPAAQYMIGLMYHTAKGVPHDLVMARMWYNLAAAQGHEQARRFRDKLAHLMTAGQIAKAEALATKWKPKKIGVNNKE